MRYGIFGDVHGNLEAFKEVIEAYKKESIDKYIYVGDIVGYGANPRECIEELKRLDAVTVCGNHDGAAAGVFPLDYFKPAAKRAIEWTAQILNQDEKEFLRKFELVIDKGNFSVTHGSLYRPDFFDYITDIESAYRCFRHLEKDVCFVGHTHIPMTFCFDRNVITYTFNELVELKRGVKHIVNVGSVGQPRDGRPEAAFAVFDTDRNTVEIKRVGYDIGTARKKILDAGLPAILGNRLLEGR